MELTVGMACHNDWHGVYFTIQALRLYHQDVIDRCEILVVDNDPDGVEGGWTRDFVENWVAARSDNSPVPMPAKVTYVKAPEVEGTSAPRDLVFRRASGRYVLCLDCHVMLWPGAIKSLLDYYEGDPNTGDLVSGPIYMDNLSSYGTHFDDVWRGQMWGVWASAWRCPCGYIFCPREVPTTGSPGVLYYPIMGGERVDDCPQCNKLIHVTSSWWGHEVPLLGAGYYPIGSGCGDPPFEIPAMGLGVFSCARDAWLGFNPQFRGFGGEEFYIHTKFRQAGHKCVCLPQLRWIHRFTRTGQHVPYPLNNWNKLRNHVIGHQELGLPLSRLHAEWVGNYGFPQEEWEQALAGAEWPSGHERQTKHQFAREMESMRLAEQRQHELKEKVNMEVIESVTEGSGRLSVVGGSVVVITGAGNVHTVR